MSRSPSAQVGHGEMWTWQLDRELSSFTMKPLATSSTPMVPKLFLWLLIASELVLGELRNKSTRPYHQERLPRTSDPSRRDGNRRNTSPPPP